MLDQLVAQKLFEVRADPRKLRNAIDYVTRQMQAIELIQYGHVKRSRGGTLFFVASHVQVGMVPPAVSKAVDEPGVPVIGEHNGLVGSENRIELAV